MVVDKTKNKTEEGITNLGFVPSGMSFLDAIKSVKPQRKYFVNQNEGGHRLTICDTIRMSLRELENLPYSKEKEAITEYLHQAFDFGKRMDARMKYLRAKLEENNINYTKGG